MNTLQTPHPGQDPSDSKLQDILWLSKTSASGHRDVIQSFLTMAAPFNSLGSLGGCCTDVTWCQMWKQTPPPWISPVNHRQAGASCSPCTRFNIQVTQQFKILTFSLQNWRNFPRQANGWRQQWRKLWINVFLPLEILSDWIFLHPCGCE